MDRRAAGALLALAACFAGSAAAPTVSNQTALDLYDASSEGCYYNFQHYGEGDRIMTNEPCLNCTCHNRMLMCYLRVCPFTKPIGQDCTVEKRADQCCPIVTCPDVPVDLLTSTSTTSPAEYGATGLGKLDKYGCSINGKYFPEGSKVPPTPNKPCEHCYCIRNMTTCVMQECTLHVDGCTPIYHKDVCCPVRYSCDHPDDEILGLDDMSTTVRPTPGFLLTTTTLSPVTQMTQDCVHNDQIFADGTSIKTEKACEHCYCMKGDIVCVVQECGTPMENEGKNCTSQPPREGQCCPDTYICEGDELPTEFPEFATQSIYEDLTTLIPPRRVGDEGSGYRHDDESVQPETPSIETGIEGSGDDHMTIAPLDESEKVTPSLIDESFASTEESHDLDATEKSTVEIQEATEEPDNELNTVPSGVQESSATTAPKIPSLPEEIGTSVEPEKATTQSEYLTETIPDSLRTTKESILHTTESAFRKEDESHEPSRISTEKLLEAPTTLEPTTTKEISGDEERRETEPVTEDISKATTPTLSEYTESEIVSETPSNIKEPVSHIPSDHIVTETTTYIPVTTTTANAHENEIEDFTTPQGPGRIPGEGDCLQNGITYRNYTSVPSINNCKTDCRCINSIINCDPIICSPPPEYMSNCVPTYDSVESCCPTYICDGSKETLPPQPHSQMTEKESSSPTPSDCRGDQCGQEGTISPIVPICTSDDCLSQPSETPETTDCGSENCDGVVQEPVQPELQTECGPAGCSDLTQVQQHQPPTAPPTIPESCTGSDCSLQIPVEPCEGESCKISPAEGCQNEEDCKNVESCSDGKCENKESVLPCEGENCKASPVEGCQNKEDCTNIEIPKLDAPCEGESCKTVPVDCGDTACEVPPPIQQVPEICDGQNCQKHDTTQEICTDDDCQKKDIPDTGRKPDCTSSDCEVQTQEILSTEQLDTTPEKTSDVPSITTEFAHTIEPFSSQTTEKLDTDTQTEISISHIEKTTEVSPESLPIATEKQETEKGTDLPELSDMTTKHPEYSLDERIPETSIDETKESPESSITTENVIPELSTTQASTAHPGEESISVDKKSTTLQPTAQDVEPSEDITQIPIDEEHDMESPHSTKIEESETKQPEAETTEKYYSTETPEHKEMITGPEKEKLPEDLKQDETTPSTMKEDTEESDTERENISKSQSSTTVQLESEFGTTETTQPEKPKLPEMSVTESSPSATESLEDHVTVAENVSDIEEKSSTASPFKPTEPSTIIPGAEDVITEKVDNEIATTESDLDIPTDKEVTTTSPEIVKELYTEIPTISSSEESVSLEPHEIHTTSDTVLPTSTSPDVHVSHEKESDQTTEREGEFIEVSKEPEEVVTTLPLIPSEVGSSETEISTDVGDITETPEDKIFNEQEVNTEEPSAEQHEVKTPEDKLDTESPYSSVPPFTSEEKKEPLNTDNIPPVIDVTTESTNEYITSTRPSTSQPIAEADLVHQPELDAKTTESPEFISTDQDKIIKSPVTEQYEIGTQTTTSSSQPLTTVNADDKLKPEYESTSEIINTEKDSLTESPIHEPQDSSDSTSEDQHELTTKSTVLSTENIGITMGAEAPESHVKDTDEIIYSTTSEIVPTEKQKPDESENIQTDSPYIVPESSETPTFTEEEFLGTKAPATEKESEETMKVSEKTTETYEYSETTPDMIELVEHTQTLDITTAPSVNIEGTTEKSTTVYQETHEVDQEHKLDDKLASETPEILDMQQKPDHPETELETKSPEGAEYPVTEATEHKFDDEETIKPTDSGEVDREPIKEIKPDTSELEKMPLPGESATTTKPEIYDSETASTPILDSSSNEPETHKVEDDKLLSTEQPETPIIGQEAVTSGESSTEKPESSPELQEITRIEESSTEKIDTPSIEPETETEEPQSPEIEYNVKPDDESSIKVTPAPEIKDEMEPEKEFITREPELMPNEVTVAEGIETPTGEKELEEKLPTQIPDTSITAQKDTEKEEFATSTPKVSLADHGEMLPEEFSTEEPEIDKKPIDESATEPTEKGDVELESITEGSYSDVRITESPVAEKKDTTEIPDYEKKPEEEASMLSTELPVTTDLESEIKPHEELGSQGIETSGTTDTVTPKAETSTEEPKEPELELEPALTPDKESSTEKPDVTMTEHELKPEEEYSTEKSGTEETELNAEVTPVEDRTELPEIGEGVTPEEGSMTKQPDSQPSEQDKILGQEPTRKDIEKPEVQENVKPDIEAFTEKLETPEDQSNVLEEQVTTTKPEMIPEHHIKPTEESVQESESPTTSYELLPEVSVTTQPESPESETPVPEFNLTDETSITKEPEMQITQLNIVDEEATTKKPELPISDLNLIDEETATKTPQLPVTEVNLLDEELVTKKPELPVTEQNVIDAEVTTIKPQPIVTEINVIDEEYITKQPELPVTELNVIDEESSTKKPESPVTDRNLIEEELLTKQPEKPGTEPNLIDNVSTTQQLETSEVESKPEIGLSTEKSEVPEFGHEITTKGPAQEDQTKYDYYEEKEPETSTTKSKPTEAEVLQTSTGEPSSAIDYQTTLGNEVEELPEKSTQPSIEKSTSLYNVPDDQKDIERQGEEITTIPTSTRSPVKDEPTTISISEAEISPVPDVEIPVQTEREPEKPIEVDHPKETTAPEEEFLTVTSKATTPRTEEEITTQSSPYDKDTKPQEKPQSEILPSTTAPEIPKPGFGEVPSTDEVPVPEEESHFAPSATGTYGGQDNDYEDENQPFGPGTCRYGGKVYVSAQQIPRDDPCDFCFCFRSDIICLQQSCPPPIHGCHEEPIQGFCCPRYECPVSMASTLNITTTTTTTTTTLPPHFPLNAYQGAAQRRGCQIKGHAYKVGEVVRASSGPCLHCTCGGDGQMKCDPKACTPEPMLRQMIAAAVSAKRRR